MKEKVSRRNFLKRFAGVGIGAAVIATGFGSFLRRGSPAYAQGRNDAMPPTANNPVISDGSNGPFDYYVFIDIDDGKKIKARSSRTGLITKTHATNADIVIQDCLNNLTSGGIIFIGPGMFKIMSPLYTNNNVSIIGSGMAGYGAPGSSATRNGTALVRNTTTNTHTFTHNGSYITISNLTLNGNYPGAGLGGDQSLQQFSELHLSGKHVQVDGIEGTAYQSLCISCSGITTISRCVFHDNIATGVNSGPIFCAFYTNPTTYAITTVDRCSFANVYNGAAYGSGIMAFSRNYIANIIQGLGSGGGSIGMGNNISCTVVDNIIEPPAAGTQFVSGMELVGAAEIVPGGDFYIAGNRFRGNGYAGGIVLDAGPFNSAIIKNNIIKNFGDAGIEAIGAGPSVLGVSNPFTNFIIEGNTIYDDGLGLSEGRSSAFTQKYGIRIWPGTAHNHFTIQNNIIFGNMVANILDQSTGVNKIVRGNVTHSNIAPTAITIIASPVVETAASNEYVTIAGGTYSPPSTGIDINRGGSHATGSWTQVYLQTGDVLTVNYSVAPTSMMRYPVPTDAPCESNGGLATFNGTGSQTAFVIPHGLSAAPVVANVAANTIDARGNFMVTVDATNITVTYQDAPAGGMSNVKLFWSARVYP